MQGSLGNPIGLLNSNLAMNLLLFVWRKYKTKTDRITLLYILLAYSARELLQPLYPLVIWAFSES